MRIRCRCECRWIREMQPGRTSEGNVTASVACQNGDSGVQRVHTRIAADGKRSRVGGKSISTKKGSVKPVRRETADTHPYVLCRPPPITPCRVWYLWPGQEGRKPRVEAEGPSCRRDHTPNTVGRRLCRVFVSWGQAALDRITLEDSAYGSCQQSEGRGGTPCQVAWETGLTG